VENRSDARERLLIGRAVYGAEASQFRHAPSLRRSLLIR
jgi:hypothetical protein